MRPTYLPLAVKSAAMTVGEMLPDYVVGVPSLEDALFLAEMYRRMAVGFLLMQGIPDDFFGYLCRAGQAYAHFLELAPDAAKATGKSAPLLDAIAGNDLAGAALISARSRRTWNPDKEYEDDFLYHRFLMDRFFLRADIGALSALLARYEAVLEGEDDFRLDLCKAFLTSDQALFEPAAAALIEDTTARIRRLREKERLNPDEAATTAHVSVELLAWLRLAGGLGLSLRREYPLAPEIARLFARARVPAPDAWRTIGRVTDIL